MGPMSLLASLVVATGVVVVLIGSTLATAANHRVTFKNFQHDPSENIEDTLRETLGSLLPNETVVIESFADGDVSWHIKEIQELPGCPLDDIQKLERVIKGPGTGNTFSRLFKMIVQQYFKLEAVEVEYLGPCATSKQKRSKIMSPLYSISVTTTPEPVAPTTTTEAPPTTVAATTPAQEPETTTWSPTTTGPSGFMDLPKLDDFSSVANITFSGDLNPFSSLFDKSTTATSLVTNFTTTSPTIETSTSAAGPGSSPVEPSLLSKTLNTTTLEANSLDPSNNINSQPSILSETSSLSASSNPSQTTTLTSNTATGAPSTDDPSSTSSATALGVPNQLEEQSSSPSPPPSGPFYGKYVGLVAAFLIFVAFLICSRAYNRNGMYELHTE